MTKAFKGLTLGDVLIKIDVLDMKCV